LTCLERDRTAKLDPRIRHGPGRDCIDSFDASERARANGFEWEPIREVAYLFAGIFICIIPVMTMLHAGTKGPFSAVIYALDHADGTPDNAAYFWATGLLSSFCDQCANYLVFFELPAATFNAHGPLTKR